MNNFFNNKELRKRLIEKGGLSYDIVYDSGFGDKTFGKNVDYYAVETCDNVNKIEEYIRRNINPRFILERIDFDDVEVKALLKEHEPGVFMREKGWDMKLYPDSYQKLAYITAFLKIYYSEALEKYMEPKCAGKAPIPEIQQIGIAIGSKRAYAVCHLKDGNTQLLYNWKIDKTAPDYERYNFGGYDDIYDVGIAITQIAKTINLVMECCKNMANISSAQVRVTCIEKLPYECELLEDSETEYMRSDLSGIAYKELECEGIDREQIFQKAISLCQNSDMISYVKYEDAIINMFKRCDEKTNKAEQNEVCLIYNLDGRYFRGTLISKDENGQVKVMAETDSSLIEDDLEPYENDLFYYKGLEQLVKEDVMAELGKTVAPITDMDEEACMLDFGTITRQLARGGNAKIFYDNGWLFEDADYSWESFQKHFSTEYKRTEAMLAEMLDQANMNVSDISKVYAVGLGTAFPYVWKMLENYTKAEVLVHHDPEHAVAYAL